MKTFVVLCIFAATCNAAVEKFFLVRNSVIPDVQNLQRMENVDPEDCAKRCLEMANCESFKFKAEHRKCDLSPAAVKGSELVRSIHGWELYALMPNRLRIAELTASMENDDAEIAELRNRITEFRASIAQKQEILMNATSQVDAMLDQRDQLAQETDTLVAILQSINETLSEETAKYEELVEDKTQLDITFEGQLEQILSMKMSSSNFTDILKEKQQELKDIIQSRATLESDKEEVVGEVTMLFNHAKTLTKRINDLQAELEAADEPEVYIARDCFELYKLHGVKDDGVYDIYPFGANGKSVKAYCYMGDGGGWTVIQQRDTSKGCSLSFHKTWNEYREGFGTPGDEYWLGNDAIASLSTNRQELKVYLKNSEGQYRYSHYRDFRMGSKSQNFKLVSVRYRTGNAGDMLSYLRNYSFGARDRENNNAQCSAYQNGGFWFKTSRYCAKKGWWNSCSRYAYSCSTANVNAKTATWTTATTYTLMRMRPQ